MVEGKITESVREFATVAFTLLGVLFGMMIMTFIFGLLGTTTIDSVVNDITDSVTNLTTASIDTTVFTIPEASRDNFGGNFVVIFATNGTSGENIPSNNYTINSGLGTIINASEGV